MSNQKKNKYEKQYLPADKYFCVNYDDEDLRPIYISLPKPPPIQLIDGYGLPPLEQIFKRLEIPHRLKLLEKRVYKELQEWSEKRQYNIITGYSIYKKFWEILTNEQKDFEEEIIFIKNVIWYTIHGYWCFIKGKPYYFPPWYFCFLNFWHMPEIKHSIKYPEFRYEDLKTELFKWYLYNTHETFKYLDKEGNALKNSEGKYEMINMPFRVFYGLMKPKRRRCGESNRALNNISWIAKYGISQSCPIISDSGKHALEHYKKRVLPAWRSWPLFIKPVWDGDNSPSMIHFSFPSNVYGEKSIDSYIYHVERAGERAVDSDKTHGILIDESAKLERVDPSSRWNVTKFTLAQGADIHGWAELPSTVEEMKDGGEEFFSMWTQSDFYNRDKIRGQTKSGLAREYIPAYRGYDQYIDYWGFSVINDPTDEQLEYLPERCGYSKSRKGSKDYINKIRESLLYSGSSSDMKSYRELIRKEPIKSAECWKGIGGDVGFDIEKISSRLSNLRINNYNEVIF